MHRRFLSLLCATLVLAVAAVAVAAPRDAAAKKKINEAINTQYLATKFDKAEEIILGTIKACGNKCSNPVLARAWMYVGIVRGSGKNDQAGAVEAFKKALSIDPNVQLDGALATAATKKSFASAQGASGGGGGGGVTEVTPKHHHRPHGEEVPGEMDCTPKVTEVEKRRPIPVSCTTDEEAVRGELRYKEYGSDKWKTHLMHKKGDFWQETIPCSATMTAGTLKMYVRVKDSSGDTVDTFGSKRKPYEFKIVPKTDAEPPAYPDHDPPKRCAEEVECPPDFPGCKSGGGAAQKHGTKAWGDSCTSSEQCKEGLACINGSCDTAQSCTEDADCAQGKCVGGTCQTESSSSGPAGPYKKNWLGLHVAQDLAIVGGSEVCSQDSQNNKGFACFLQGTHTQYAFDPYPGVADKISTGMAVATTRFLISYDRAIIPNLTAGVRLGYAIGGGPKAGNKSFLPIHGEIDVKYWFGGKDVLGRKGFRAYAQIGGGVAQVDAKLPVTIRDCNQYGTNKNTKQTDPTAYDNCRKAVPGTAVTQYGVVPLDAYKKLGQSFVTLGGGGMYAITKNSGIVLNVNFMYMLPTTGVVIEPSLGYELGL